MILICISKNRHACLPPEHIFTLSNVKNVDKYHTIDFSQEGIYIFIHYVLFGESLDQNEFGLLSPTLRGSLLVNTILKSQLRKQVTVGAVLVVNVDCGVQYL